MKQGGRHPIVAGVTALVAVAVGVGLIVGIGMFVGANILGLGGGGAASDQATDPDAGASLYAPSPKPTKTATGPAITLDASPTSAPEKKAGSVSTSTSSSPSESAAEKPGKKEITLQTGIVVAKPMERIDITGIYPGGEGAILRLERDEGEGWQEFGIPDVSVTGEQFSTAIQTGRVGKHRFRMKDIDTGTFSNVVSVTIG
ncbi:hypothetical protein [Nocardioides albus]|uniref:Uncharacterized protein n=1 Tax=Nocardioides albus TaxID=1841 RepID=A0A7W5A751_9ACTN|nr:hypothetical protein [Nocardioides albus]MBB3090665.1 hypothetical protein [Nocardioides albus]GGU25588.1 hypothetical protein GCM10007979_25490 [Nocardioides albus]